MGPMLSCNVSSHPLLLHWLTELRAKGTPASRFRHLVQSITQILIFEATKGLKLSQRAIETPLESIPNAPHISERLVFISIMRAGNAMLDAALESLELSECGHIGLYRKEIGKAPVEYFFKIPPQSHEAQVFLLDPMLATGFSAVAAIEKLKEKGINKLKFLCLVAAPEGVEKLRSVQDCDIEIFAASLDRELNSKGYILPGLGDAGDRIYGTPHDS